MAFPFIPLALAAGGAALNAFGQVKAGQEEAENTEAAIRARNRVMKKELGRQSGYTRRAADVFTDSLDLFAPRKIDKRMDKADRVTTKNITNNLPTDFGSIGTGLAPQALAADEAAFVGNATDENARHADTLGQLLSHDQYLFNNDRALAKTGYKLGKIADFARGSANVAGIEHAVAGNNAEQAPSIWGPLLQAGGTIGSYTAGRGGFPGFSLPTKPLIPQPGSLY